MKRFFTFLFFFSTFNLFYAQEKNEVKINFKCFYGENKINLINTIYFLHQNDSIQIDKLKFYVSGFKLLNGNKIVYHEEESYHLIDFSSLETSFFSMKNIPDVNFDKLKFNLGIDSSTNNAGALGGDLDPTKGMYWTWQNGYINFKLEGKSNLCATRNKEFVFHLGGFQQPYSSLQKIEFPLSNSVTNSEISLILDLEKFFQKIDLSKTNQIMSPSLAAVKLSEFMKSIFSISY
jgi:hypothetical protein